jgi:hypothetical protein
MSKSKSKSTRARVRHESEASPSDYEGTAVHHTRELRHLLGCLQLMREMVWVPPTAQQIYVLTDFDAQEMGPCSPVLVWAILNLAVA